MSARRFMRRQLLDESRDEARCYGDAVRKARRRNAPAGDWFDVCFCIRTYTNYETPIVRNARGHRKVTRPCFATVDFFVESTAVNSRSRSGALRIDAVLATVGCMAVLACLRVDDAAAQQALVLS